MKFSIEELVEVKEYFEINGSKDCLVKLKNIVKLKKEKFDIDVKIDFDSLYLGDKLYGKTKSETKLIQKKNCKNILGFYKLIKKIVKVLIKKTNFDGRFFVSKLSEKKNNNDMMIVGLLDIDYNVKTFSKMKAAYGYACDYFDAENSLNKMCDFHDNHCTKHRDKNIEKSTGCCPSFCKIRVPGQACTHKNLSCKIFMCDYLIYEKGFYFTPNTVPVLVKHMTPLERAITFGILCRTEKKSLKFLWFIRGLTLLYFIVILAVILMFCL